MLNTQARSLKEDSNETTFTRQGSLRRVLTSGHKENLFSRQNQDLNKFYKKFHQEYVVLAEYKMVQSENFQGVYVIPSKEICLSMSDITYSNLVPVNLTQRHMRKIFVTTWFGVIFIRSGIYEDGIFRFVIHLPENFPDGGHPQVIFHSDIYHPVIHMDTNELHLLDGFPLWNKGEHHLWQVLKYIQWIFYNFNSSLAHAVNTEAVSLYKDNQAAYIEKIKTYVKESQEHVYDPPPIDDKHYITFEKYTPTIHDSVKSNMLMQDKEIVKPTGHSWVSPGSFKPLTRDCTPVSEDEI